MKARYVIDTNVLIAATAAISPTSIDATPPGLKERQEILDWLTAFEQSTSRFVLDYDGKIADEYQNKLDYNDYGISVLTHKYSTAAVDFVQVNYDCDGHAILNTKLQEIVHDAADRKMVAAACASLSDFGEGCIAFAGDTDWHDWEKDLIKEGLLLEPIIESWSRQKHQEKSAKKK